MKKIIFTFALVLFWTYCSASPVNYDTSIEKQKDTINIKMNESLLFEGVVDKDNHIKLVKVDKIQDSTKTISIELSYDKSFGTTLSIKNPFSLHLTYTAEIYIPQRDKYIVTSTIPVSPKISSFEMWPENLKTLRLSNFTLQNE